MKTLFVTLAAFVVLVIIGCQETSITDPEVSESAQKIQNADTYKPGFISLEGTLSDPYPIGNSFYMISGQIEYDYRLIIEDPMLPMSQRYASLHLTTNADLQYFCTVCSPPIEDELAGFITNESQEYLCVTSRSITIFEKSFAVQGREDGMVLKCRFLLTTGGIELSAMWLAFEDEPNIATNEIN